MMTHHICNSTCSMIGKSLQYSMSAPPQYTTLVQGSLILFRPVVQAVCLCLFNNSSKLLFEAGVTSVHV